MNKFIEKIGNFEFNIYTKLKKIEQPFNRNIPQNRFIPTKINIMLLDYNSVTKKFIEYCKKTYKRTEPIELRVFYSKINKILNKNFSLNNHVNEYYCKENNIFAIFPYYTDSFYLHYSYNTNNIYLIGNEKNLNRVILDFLTVDAKYLPLHASAVGKNETSLCFFSDSGCGKTSIMIKLLETHFDFIADDSLFISQDKVFRVYNMINIRKDFPNNPVISSIVSKEKSAKISLNTEYFSKRLGFKLGNSYANRKYILLLKDKNNIKKYDTYNLLHKLDEPFPAISMHSFWCAHYMVKNNIENFITDKIYTSVRFWEEELKDTVFLYTNEIWKKNRSDTIEKIINI